MSKFMIGTNWKMMKTLQEGREYTNQLASISNQLNHKKMELFIIPSFTMLSSIEQEVKHTNIKLGAQNMHWEERGAYTGEISPLMLKEVGVQIVELGHSERRIYFNENDEDINKKVHAALKYDLRPLICIGENLLEKENKISIEVLSKQIKVALKNVGNDHLENIIVAYEPVWAIGEKGVPANGDYVSFIHNNIRNIMIDLYGQKGNDIKLLYGGSINRDNYVDYFKIENVNGLFIGRAAWDITTFKTILKTCNSMLNN